MPLVPSHPLSGPEPCMQLRKLALGLVNLTPQSEGVGNPQISGRHSACRNRHTENKVDPELQRRGTLSLGAFWRQKQQVLRREEEQSLVCWSELQGDHLMMRSVYFIFCILILLISKSLTHSQTSPGKCKGTNLVLKI